jgi:hypothetical protein
MGLALRQLDTECLAQMAWKERECLALEATVFWQLVFGRLVVQAGTTVTTMSCGGLSDDFGKITKPQKQNIANLCKLLMCV